MSRYSNYSSRYGSDRDYSSSYLSGTSGSGRRNYTSGTTSSLYSSPRSYDSYSSTTSPYSSNSYSSKYSSSDYTSKYRRPSIEKSEKKMEDFTATAPIVKDEIDELNYDEPQTPVETEENPEVLQESQIDEFEDQDNKDVAETIEVKLTLNDEEINETVVNENSIVLENGEEEEEEAEAEPIEQELEISAPVAQELTKEAEVNENRQPSPTVLNAKKLGGIAWPPKEEGLGEKRSGDAEAVPKKRVSDLIARFNTGNLENDSAKPNSSYKSEYGASANTGKVSHNFA